MTDENDPHIWLEEVDSERALSWVRSVNAETVAKLTSVGGVSVDQQRLLQIYDSEKKIAYVNQCGDFYYNFWRDARHERGIWRRTTWSSYLSDDPQWDVVLDIDDLAAKEGENWVWHGAQFLRPDFNRCFIVLSRGGADAHVQREFDLPSRRFVDGGFQLAEAKSAVSWIDRDTVWVGTDFGPGSVTNSGYPRTVKRWRRHSLLEDAELVFEGEQDNISVYAGHDDTPRFERSLVMQNLTFYRNRLYEVSGNVLKPIPKPEDAIAGVFRSWIALELRSDWQINNQTFLAGSLLVAKYDEFMHGDAEFEILFKPTSSCFLQSWSNCQDHLILNLSDNVSSRIEFQTPSTSGWQRSVMDTTATRYDHVSVSPVDRQRSNKVWVHVTGYLTPTALGIAEVGQSSRIIKTSPNWFDTHDLSVAQHFATSRDGTRVPYFQVGPSSKKRAADSPTLLYSYGGFEASLLPNYSATIGTAWLEQGGTYVVANIRGGGEYGPAWHQSALKENRFRAFEDFIAVGEDLITRGVTKPRSLGILGGSNGGLLMGAMYTQEPALWGAVVCSVPLLDMKRYTKLLAGASWIAEYGDPDDAEQWAYLRRYSPYHNIDPASDYPPILFTTSTRDDRVHPGHARKMAYALMDAGKNVSYYENIEGGHGGSANNEQLAFMKTLEFQFLWNTLT